MLRVYSGYVCMYNGQKLGVDEHKADQLFEGKTQQGLSKIEYFSF